MNETSLNWRCVDQIIDRHYILFHVFHFFFNMFFPYNGNGIIWDFKCVLCLIFLICLMFLTCLICKKLIFLICIKMSFFNIRRSLFYFINLHIFARVQIKSNVKTFQSTIHSYQATQSFLSLKSTFLKQLLTPTIVRFSMHFHLPENNTSYIQEATL